MAHSGVFSGTLKPEFRGAGAEPAAGGGAAAAPPAPATPAPAGAAAPRVDAAADNDRATRRSAIRCQFVDPAAFRHDGAARAEGKRATIGADAELAGFTKQFKDPEVAVKTRFLWPRRSSRWPKSTASSNQTEHGRRGNRAGKRILEEALRDYPDTSLAAQGEFLLANLAQELEYQEAIGRYCERHPHLAGVGVRRPVQFKKALCLEKLENYTQACEEYAAHLPVPGQPAGGRRHLRLGNYFYRNEKFKTAGPDLPQVPAAQPQPRLARKALFLAGQCHMRMKEYKEVGRACWNCCIKTYENEHEIRAEAMYWMGDCYSQLRDYVKAYQTFKKPRGTTRRPSGPRSRAAA